jgi:hypothetical protein
MSTGQLNSGGLPIACSLKSEVRSRTRLSHALETSPEVGPNALYYIKYWCGLVQKPKREPTIELLD